MGNSKETIQITDEETGEIFDLNITSLVSDIRDRMIARRRLQTEATVWSKLSESQQPRKWMVARGLRQGQGRGLARGIKIAYILGRLYLAQEKATHGSPAIVRGFLLSSSSILVTLRICANSHFVLKKLSPRVEKIIAPIDKANNFAQK